MEKVKKALNHVFIDGLSGMALGLFATLIIGTIIQQIGNLIGGTVGDTLYLFGKAASVMTSAGIGIGVAYKFKEPVYVTLSAATAGMVGGYASKILAGTLIGEGGVVVLAGPGEPLGAFIAAIVGIELGHLVAGRTKIDLLVTPLCDHRHRFCRGPSGGAAHHPVYDRPWYHHQLGHRAAALPHGHCGIGTHRHDPDTAHQLRSARHHPEPVGLAAGAAVVGCCCSMVGFAVASYRENKIWRSAGPGCGNVHAPGAQHCAKTGDLAACYYFQCDSGTGEYPGVPYDQQCHRLRHGNSRSGGTDHDLSGNDRDTAGGCRAGRNRSHAFPSAGCYFSCCF